MRTIRLPDPFKPGRRAERLPFGSSAWAADSCLVEWSTFEREWLGPEPRPASAGEDQRRMTPLGVVGLLFIVAALAVPLWQLAEVFVLAGP